MQSILNSIKTVIGLEVDDNSFDNELLIHTNSILTLKLPQLGIGPDYGFSITSNAETWGQFLSEEELKKLEAIKTYVGLNVKLIFDPPTNNSHIESIKSTIDEFEWRLNIQAETMKKEE